MEEGTLNIMEKVYLKVSGEKEQKMLDG